MSNELKIIEKIELVPFFTESEGVDDVLAKIAKEARAHVPDTSTAKGRAAIKANVTLVTKSKTYLEGKGKELAAEYKSIPQRIDATRRKTKEFLNDLQIEVRQKLTEYEAEEKRIEAEEAARVAAEELARQVDTDHEIGLLLNDKIDRDKAEAAKAEADRIEAERVAYEARIKAEAEQSAREDEQRKQKEAEDKRAAEERARIAEQARKDSEAEAEIERAKKAEADAKQAIIDAENAAIQAKIDADLREKQAAENERIRIKQEQDQIQREDEARAADVDHKRTINNEILGAMVSAGISATAANQVISAIAQNKIPHVKINY